MKSKNLFLKTIIPLFVCSLNLVFAQLRDKEKKPEIYTFSVVNGLPLKAHVFKPAKQRPEDRFPAIVVFHGGGWAMGDPEWSYGRARHFASRGMVAVAAQYRLSDQKTITPIEAMADARTVIRWIREQSVTLGINPYRLAAYGWSAGAHLAVCAAIFIDSSGTPPVSSRPDALILVSPAVHLETDGWLRKILGSRASVSSISPSENVIKGLPPTFILQGSNDSVTPLKGVKLFVDRMKKEGNECELHVYDRYGHLFTPPGIPDDGWPQPDPKIQADALQRTDQFLESHGFIKKNQ